jgi:hypothetical protein
VNFDWLSSRTAAWDRLADRVLDPNPFFTRPVLGAHAEHGIASAGLRVLAVRRGETLAALLPFRPGGARLGFGPRANVAWTSPYVTNATPLVAADALPETIDALLDAMASAAPFRFWMIPLLALDSPVAAALRTAVERRGWPSGSRTPWVEGNAWDGPGEPPLYGGLRPCAVRPMSGRRRQPSCRHPKSGRSPDRGQSGAGVRRRGASAQDRLRRDPARARAGAGP